MPGYTVLSYTYVNVINLCSSTNGSGLGLFKGTFWTNVITQASEAIQKWCVHINIHEFEYYKY